MTKTRIIRTAVIGLLSLTVGLGPALAQPGTFYNLYEYTYYSNASQTQAVGIMTEHCYEPATLSGETSQYYTRVRIGRYNMSTGDCVEY
ncbi:MAG: DUF6289 family protein [Allosphingosinicella sp.]